MDPETVSELHGLQMDTELTMVHIVKDLAAFTGSGAQITESDDSKKWLRMEPETTPDFHGLGDGLIIPLILGV